MDQPGLVTTLFEAEGGEEDLPSKIFRFFQLPHPVSEVRREKRRSD